MALVGGLSIVSQALGLEDKEWQFVLLLCSLGLLESASVGFQKEGRKGRGQDRVCGQVCLFMG